MFFYQHTHPDFSSKYKHTLLSIIAFLCYRYCNLCILEFESRCNDLLIPRCRGPA